MKKKIIVFSCKGGGGHITASQAIKAYLAEYDVVITDVFTELFAPVDPFYYLSFRKYVCQDFYNFLLRKSLKGMVNILPYIGFTFLKFQSSLLKRIFITHIQKESPQLFISVIPLFNKIFIEISQELNIPYLLIPTDLDTQLYNVTPPYSNKVTVGLGFDYPEIRNQFTNATMPPERIKVIGFPVRPSFLKRKNLKKIKKTLQIPTTKPIILLMMGATGSSAALTYLKTLRLIEQPFHLIISVGRNAKLRSRLLELALPDHISLTIVDFSADIADLMAISHLCITKPGPVTFAETLYMNLPVFFDNTGTSLTWERFNLEFVERHKIGDIITNFDELKGKVEDFLQKKEAYFLMKKSLCKVYKKSFDKEIKKLVNALTQ